MQRKKYNIRTEFAEFIQGPLDDKIENLRAISNNFQQLRTDHQWGNEVVCKIHIINHKNFSQEIIEVSPKNHQATNLYPAIIYYHGGGFFSTYSIGQLEHIEKYALGANCKVFLVTYRLSTDFPFPHGFNDCFEGYKWLVDNAVKLGVDVNKFLVLGDSAGGALATGVVQKAYDEKQTKPLGLFLIYPALDYESKTASANNFVDVPIWNTNNNKVMWSTYLRNIIGSEIPQYASPAHHPIFEGIPSTYIETAEFDAVRDEGIDFADKLKSNGIPVKLNKTKGTIHAYDFVACEFVWQMIEQRITIIKEFFTNPSK